MSPNSSHVYGLRKYAHLAILATGRPLLLLMRLLVFFVRLLLLVVRLLLMVLLLRRVLLMLLGLGLLSVRRFALLRVLRLLFLLSTAADQASERVEDAPEQAHDGGKGQNAIQAPSTFGTSWS